METLYAFYCSKKLTFGRLFGFCSILLLVAEFAQAQTITGTVFRDFNADGIYTAIPASGTYTYGEPGVSGIIVTAYSSNSAAAPISATTNASGAYTLSVGSTGQFRLEFTNVVAGDFTGFVSTTATANKTDIQFVNGGSTNINLGINYPANYCGVTNPYLVTPCYTNGNPLAPPSSSTLNPANDNWLVGWQYNGAANSGRNTYLSKGSIGSTWGLAYDRTDKLLFTAAFLKRHSGFGTGGPGQIYSVNMTNPTSASATITPFVNLQTDLGISVGTDPRLTTQLPNDKTVPNHDVAAFDLVGKMSLGDIDLSDDDRTLWVMNLFDQALYELPIGSPATKPTTFTKHVLPSAGCVNGTLRPFATKFYRGKVYVGAVCSGETSASTATGNLVAYVYAHDPAGATSNFTQVMSFPLNYLRGAVTSNGSGSFTLANWRPWISQWTSIPASYLNTGYTQTVYPQPILSDIDFDVNGEMIVAFVDRFGHQAGNNNYSPITSSSAVYEATAAGDMLRAGRKADGTYQIESNASVTHIPANGGAATTITTVAANQSIPQGPGGGEFYWQDMFNERTSPTSVPATTGGHEEILVGGITLWPGQGEVVVTAFDPFTNFRAAGARYMNNVTGADNYAYQVLTQDGGLTTAQRAATFGKAASLGDLELLCNPSPVQIGNRVWNDLNNNGIQDAGEPALAGVTVILKGPGSTTVATVTTNSNGEYYFSNATGNNATGFAYNLTSLSLGSSYSLCFPTSFSTLSLSTKPNSATGANADRIDSDPTAAGVISFTLGQAGENNFSYDAGYAILPCAITTTALAGTCSPATNTYTLTGTISLTSTAGGVATITDGARSTTVTVPAAATAVAYSLTGLTSGTNSHTVVVNLPGCASATATYTAPASCTPVLTVVVATPVCNTLTNTYTATGTVSLTNATVGSLTITDNGTTAATISVTAGQTSATFTLTGVSGSTPPSHTVVAALGTTTASTTYATPASCTVCSLSIATASLPQGQVGTAYSQTIITSGGTALLSFSLTGSLPAGLSLNPTTGVISGTPTASGTASITITVTDSKACTAVVPLTLVTSAAPVCSLTATATPGACDPATNTYAVTGSVSATNTPANQSLTISVGSASTIVTLTGDGPVSYTLAGLTSDGAVNTVSVISSAAACGTTSVTFTAPASCTVAPANPMLSLEKFVNQTRATLGDILTYTVVLTNTGSTSATNVVVSDVSTTGLTYVPNSASAPAGTAFTPATPTSTWSVPLIAAGQSLSLTFQAKADSSGILYNTATIPGDTARVCTTIPVIVCTGDTYLFRLTAAPGRSSYQWYKDNVEIIGQTTNVLDVTAPGTYSLAVDNATGQCPDFSCCPFIIEEAPLPTFQAIATPATCIGSTPQANGSITLSQFQAGYTYQYSLGTTFNEGASLSGPAQAIPAGGVIVSNLASPVVATAYTVRVYNASGCFTDVTVMLMPTVCGCPPNVCVPLVIQQTRGIRR